MDDGQNIRKKTNAMRIPDFDRSPHLVQGSTGGNKFFAMKYGRGFRDRRPHPDHFLFVCRIFLGEAVSGSHEPRHFKRQHYGGVGRSDDPVGKFESSSCGKSDKLSCNPLDVARISEDKTAIDEAVRAKTAREFRVRRFRIAVVVEKPDCVFGLE
jgi:hypothetical protein